MNEIAKGWISYYISEINKLKNVAILSDNKYEQFQIKSAVLNEEGLIAFLGEDNKVLKTINSNKIESVRIMENKKYVFLLIGGNYEYRRC